MDCLSLNEECLEFDGEDGVGARRGGVHGGFVALTGCNSAGEDPEGFLKCIGVDLAEARDKAAAGCHVSFEREMLALLDEGLLVIEEVVNTVLIQFIEREANSVLLACSGEDFFV
jgi:hypothetical protein